MLKQWSETDSVQRAAHHAPSIASSARAKFNVFQKLIRQWENIHPYNGAQILKIRGTVDLDLCRKSWLQALESMNLGVVCVGNDSYHHRCLNGEAMYHGVALCPPGTLVNQFISDQLNQSFDLHGGVPFRPFIIQEAGHFWMGLVYQHWVADSASIRMLIHEWFTLQFDPARFALRSTRFHVGGYLSLFGPHRDSSPPLEVLLSSLRWPNQFKKARRIEDREKFRDMNLQFSILTAPDGLIDPLRRAARAMGATVNDLFLAAIAQVCNQFVPTVSQLRRRELAIGSIVDLRPRSNQPLADVFDLLLGFTSISCRDVHLGDLSTLVQSIVLQTRQQKRGGLAMSSCLRMTAGLVAGKFLTREKIIEFYRKRVPLTGASSNVNLNRCWAARYANGPLLDYIRVAPTGPMTPVVFTTTTLGNHLSIGLTCRSAIIPPETSAQIGQTFISLLTDIAKLIPQ